MGLSPECTSYLGRQVLVEPTWGHGWTMQVPDPSGWYPGIDPPDPFHMTVDWFSERRGEIVGGLGTIEQTGHVLDGHRVSFAVRHVGEVDFVRTPGHYNLIVGGTEPVPETGWPCDVGAPSIVGFGVIRDDSA